MNGFEYTGTNGWGDFSTYWSDDVYPNMLKQLSRTPTHQMDITGVFMCLMRA